MRPPARQPYEFGPEDFRRRPFRRHGGRETRLYTIWIGMRERCYTPSARNYSRYGGKGVTVCAEWLTEFAAFRDWALANGYQSELSIDRIDPTGNYEPENCRWATAKEQQRNKTNNRHITAFGETKVLSEWAEDERCTVSLPTLTGRLNRGWSAERAVSTPVFKPPVGER